MRLLTIACNSSLVTMCTNAAHIRMATCAHNISVWQFRVKIKYYSTTYVFQLHHCIQSAISLNFCKRKGSYMLCRCLNIWCIYIQRTFDPHPIMEAQQFDWNGTFEIRNRMIIDFYKWLLYVIIPPTHWSRPPPFSVQRRRQPEHLCVSMMA